LGLEHAEPRPDENAMKDGSISGYVVISSRYLSKQPFWDNSGLRSTEPVARFGNLFVYHGTRKSPAIIAPGLFFGSLGAIYSPQPDLERAEQMLKASIALDPTPFFVHLQLGNVYLKRGMRDEAERAYSEASRRASPVPEQQRLLDDQLARLRSGVPTGEISELRNPAME
jgi:tetratricopeptide (TPR) repeat protein